MGPSIIFDKSALQALSIDECVWLDQFFCCNVTPLFYIETLADLEKEVKKGREPKEVIGELALKTPESAVPNVHHKTIILYELAGSGQSTGNRPLVAGGVPKKTEAGELLLAFDNFPEFVALNRWRNGDFLEIEQKLAKTWRQELQDDDVDFKVSILQNILPKDFKPSNLSDLMDYINTFCDKSDKPSLLLMLKILEVPEQGIQKVVKRWEDLGRPSLKKFAPYSTHVFKVNLLYYLGIHKGYISGVRKSNKADMAYLYYLPFTMVFVSGDKLHHRTAPLLMDMGQTYIKLDELKGCLRELDEHFDKLPDEIKKRGVMSFVGYPPSELTNLVSELWDKYMREDWREISKDEELTRLDPVKPVNHGPVPKHIKDFEKAKNLTPEEALHPDNNPEQANQMFIKRKVSTHKGKWQILSDEVINSK
jgi:hypothetical protein